MILFVVAAVFALLAVHPFTTYPASLLVLRALTRRRPARVEHGGALPSFAICVPAYNEEDSIVAKAENMLALQRTVPACELLIYVDAATDRTVERLAPYRDRITVVVAETRAGKSNGLNMLVARATAAILVFSDANVLLDGDALRRIGARFTDPAVGCVCGHLRYEHGAGTAVASSGNLYWKLEERIRQLESDTIGVVGADGSLFAVRRSLYPTVPGDIIDDFFVSMTVLLGRHRVVRAPDAYAFERICGDGHQEFGRKVRIACQAFNVHRLLWKEIARARFGVLYGYISHRLLKWLIIYNLAAAGGFALVALCALLPASIVATATLGAAAVACLAWRIGIPPMRQVGAILVAFVGVGLGVLRSVQGERFQTWTPMSAIRSRDGARP